MVEAKTPAEAARRVAELAVDKEAEEIVVGMPLLLSGERGEQAQRTERFVELLRGKFAGKVATWDERLTSAQGERALREMRGERSRRPEKPGKVDETAATLLLQSYLDSLRRSPLADDQVPPDPVP